MLNLDFETYSAAGHALDLAAGKWRTASPAGGTKRGIGLVGAFVYAQHPTCDILVAAYSLDGGQTVKQWRPGDPAPSDMLDYVAAGGLVTAWNSFFEWCIWNQVGVRRYGWPVLPIAQTRDSMARAFAWSLPGALEKASGVVFGQTVKDTEGARIMRKLSQPRNATKNDPRLRFDRHAPKTDKEHQEWTHLDSYCAQDVRAEIETAKQIPDLSPSELEVWLIDQKINARGIGIDLPLVDACAAIMRNCRGKAAVELSQLTGGEVTAATQATKILNWTNRCTPGATLDSLEDATLTPYLDTIPDGPVKRVLQIRQEVGGSAPAKLVPLKMQAASDGRIRGVLQFCGAQRTRRWAGRGPQFQNFPNSGPDYYTCPECGEVMGVDTCPNCVRDINGTAREWDIVGIEAAIADIMGGTLDRWRNPAALVSGVLRSTIKAAEGHEFLSSDYSAIEAVVMACVAGEQWMIDVFRGDCKLYERTAAKITGLSVDEILDHKRTHGTHHPKRKLGKVASLASQYQGARGAWLKFGADKFLSNAEIDDGVKSWREANPAIVHYWHACEAAAIGAVQCPGSEFPVMRANGSHTGVTYRQDGRALYCFFPSGDYITYLDPAIEPRKKLSSDGYKIIELCEALQADPDPYRIAELQNALMSYPHIFNSIAGAGFTVTGKVRHALTEVFFSWQDTLTYYGWDTMKHKWIKTDTYGGKLSENNTQGIARNILAHAALIPLEAAGYPVVLHTHDEVLCEVPAGTGSIEELEAIMSTMPAWAANWPIRAAGGWRGVRYRK